MEAAWMDCGGLVETALMECGGCHFYPVEIKKLYGKVAPAGKST